MKNTFGQNIAVTIFGESHGEYIGAVIDGLAPGIEIKDGFIAEQLEKRRPYGKISTGRVEEDKFKIVSGVFENRTTGTPICILIPNSNTKSGDYEKTKNLLRPGHADYAVHCKYHGFEDYRGGGHTSGRITAALVAAGAVMISALKNKGIIIGTHIKKCAGVEDRNFENLTADTEKLNSLKFAVLDDEKQDLMQNKIKTVAAAGDSVGGILETAVSGLPEGLGEPWFDSIEGLLSHAMFSIPAVKGIEFGKGFEFADMYGSEANDPFISDGAKISTVTNNNGGINGGITNGMPVVFRLAIKPTPSIYKQQQTVNIETGENTLLNIQGRHDPAIIHRARVVADSVTAIVLCDILAGRYGTDYFLGA